MLLPTMAVAADTGSSSPSQSGGEIFEARVEKILEEKDIERENGEKAKQQNIQLRGLTGRWLDKEIKYEGISDVDVANANVYEAGDTVLVQLDRSPGGENKFYIIDFVRSDNLYFLAFIFVATVLIIGKTKGFKALVSLVFSFFVIIEFILPRILAGSNPLLVGLFGAFAILLAMIYLTEGWGRKSHLAILSVFFSLLITLILSIIFTNAARLTGFAQEEVIFLMGAGKKLVDFHGLLLSGILIGAVGVLDDVIVGQIEAVEQIRAANPNLSAREVFRMAYRVGNTHLGSIVNTLFLTYAGASLPLLLLFTIKQEPFLSFTQVINNEVIATEIVRTLVGSIGVAMSMPISTYLAAYWMKSKKGGGGLRLRYKTSDKKRPII